MSHSGCMVTLLRLVVRFICPVTSSTKNYRVEMGQPNPKKKDSEQASSSQELFGMDGVKTLLNKSLFYVLRDGVEMARLHLGIRKALLISPIEGIKVQENQADGWVASPGKTLLNVLGDAYSGPDDVRVAKRCHVEVHSVSGDGSLRYISARHARLSLIFHFLFNLQSKQIKHWCSTILQNRSEFVLLAQLYPTRYCTDVVCTVFRDGGADGAISYKVFDDSQNGFMRGELVRTGW